MDPSNNYKNTVFIEALNNDERPMFEVIQKFTEPVDAAVKNGEEEGPFWRAWGDVTTLARQTPHEHQERLVKFMSEIRKQPGPFKENGGTVKVWGEDATWKSLTLLGPEMRESWNDAPDGPDAFDEGWVNINAFAARITALSSPREERDGMDFALYSIWTLREALEDLGLENKLPNRSKLQAAAMWMIYAAPRLRDHANENRTFEGKSASEGRNLEGRNWRGFSIERWDIWKERFLLARDRSQDTLTKELLNKACSNM